MLKIRCHYWKFRALMLCMDINITSCYSNLRVTDFKRNNAMDRSQKASFTYQGDYTGLNDQKSHTLIILADFKNKINC